MIADEFDELVPCGFAERAEPAGAGPDEDR